MLKQSSPGGMANDLAERAERWLDTLPLDDRWHVHATTATVARLRTSAYVDEELHFANHDGTSVASSLSGAVIDARPGHRVTVVHLSARNSGRDRPVVLFDHDNGNTQVLSGNFAPLLRSRFEGLVLLAGLCLGGLLLATGLWLRKLMPHTGRRRRDPSTFFFILAAAMVPLGIIFTDKRRRRLRRSLEQACGDIVAQLKTHAPLSEGEIAISLAANETPQRES